MEIFFAPTGWDQGDCDYYDVSLADGYNIPVQIEPVPGTYWTGGTANNWCIRAGGTVDLLEKIQELQYQDLAEKMLVLKNNRPVAIFSSCWYETHVNKTGPGRIIDNITYDQGEQIWNLSCCKGNCDTEATCPINDLPPDHQTSQFFSTFYDHTYTYQYGDDQANIPCKGEKSSGQLTSYLITFCGGRILTPPTIGDLSAEVVDPADPLTIRFTADVESGTSLDYSWDVETDGIEDYTGTAPVHSYDTPGAYRVTLTVTDESGLSAQTEETFLISDYSIPILPGWNFISVPKSPDLGHANASTLFAPVSSAIRVILTYDVATGQWAIMGADTPVIPLQGFWLRSEANVSLPLLFDLDPAQLPPSLHLYPGWNAIGHGDVGPLAARLALQAVKENWSVLIPFNATEQRYEISIINGANGTHSDDREMEPGQGYWLFMAGEGELTAP
jgi:PKD repeat protein